MYVREPRQRRAGPRRGHRRLPLGAPPRDGRAAAARRADAQSGRLRGPDHPQHRGRPRRRSRREHRRGALGHRRGAGPRRLRVLERAGGRRRRRRGRAARLRTVPRGHLLRRRGRRPHRAPAVAHVDHRPPGRARRRHLGRPAAAVPGPAPTPGFRAPTIPSNRLVYYGTGAGQAVVAGRPRNRRRRALQQLDPGPRPADRRDALVLPAHSRRQPRHGRDVRAHPDRLRRPAVGVQHGQAGHPVGARPHDRRVHEGGRPRLSEPGRRRSRDRRVHLPRGHGLRRGRGALLLSEHRRLQGPAGDGVPPGHGRAVRAAQPAVRDGRLRAGGAQARGRRHRRRAGPAEPLPSGRPGAARRVPGARRPHRRDAVETPAAGPVQHRGADHGRGTGLRRRLGAPRLRLRRRDGRRALAEPADHDGQRLSDHLRGGRPAVRRLRGPAVRWAARAGPASSPPT